MSDKPDKKAKKPPKADKAKKGKKGAESGARVDDEHIRLSTHPAAATSVRRARARCGLIAFAVVGLLSLHAGVPAFDATYRALLAGMAAHLAGWYLSVSVWRQIVRHQAHQAVHAYNERMRVSRQSAADHAAAEMAAVERQRADAEASWAANVGS
jgi:hypothetical protein